jgi:hypothetical protein
MILSALYYPHTGIQSHELMKQALLLWDQVEYIAPDEYFRPVYSAEAKLGREGYSAEEAPLMQEAMEILGRRYVPKDEEKEAAHSTILKIANGGIPERIAKAEGYYSAEYEIYKHKLLPKTWSELDKLQLIKESWNTDDYVTQTPFGLLMMSVLTDCCAGTHSCKVTDRGAAYLSIADALQALKAIVPNKAKSKKSKLTGLSKNLEELFDAQHVDAAQEYVVTTTLRTVDVEGLTLADLIQLRKREAKEQKPWLRAMRHKYLESVNAYSKDLLSAKDEKDLLESDRKLEASLKAELQQLREELKNITIGFVKRDLLTSVAAGSLGSAALLLGGVPPQVASAIE